MSEDNEILGKIAIFGGGAAAAAVVISLLPLLILFGLLCGVFSDSFSNGENVGGRTFSFSVEYGDAYDNDIDTSGFVDTDTKNNEDLATFAVQAWQNHWGYVWGTIGYVLTTGTVDQLVARWPDNVGIYEDFIRSNWVGRRTTDCIGLIKSYLFLDSSGYIIYDATKDYSADQMLQLAQSQGRNTGAISSIPEIPGLGLWMPGHAGIYIGNGYAIEAMGTKYGVVRTEVDGRGWQQWYEIPFIDYEGEET